MGSIGRNAMHYFINFRYRSFQLSIIEPKLSKIDGFIHTIWHKFSIFFTRLWNVFTTAVIVTFIIGYIFRSIPNTKDSYGRVVLICNTVLWYIKLLDYLRAYRRLGIIITMTGRMVCFRTSKMNNYFRCVLRCQSSFYF